MSLKGFFLLTFAMLAAVNTCIAANSKEPSPTTLFRQSIEPLRHHDRHIAYWEGQRRNLDASDYDLDEILEMLSGLRRERETILKMALKAAPEILHPFIRAYAAVVEMETPGFLEKQDCLIFLAESSAKIRNPLRRAQLSDR